ncbi:hypothetical protein C7M52_01082 [Mixta theicola]|nr:hypothetical protein C7M52_01082 [Mixta theicola]
MKFLSFQLLIGFSVNRQAIKIKYILIYMDSELNKDV